MTDLIGPNVVLPEDAVGIEAWDDIMFDCVFLANGELVVVSAGVVNVSVRPN